jgi:hypothetical protein
VCKAGGCFCLCANLGGGVTVFRAVGNDGVIRKGQDYGTQVAIWGLFPCAALPLSSNALCIVINSRTLHHFDYILPSTAAAVAMAVVTSQFTLACTPSPST